MEKKLSDNDREDVERYLLSLVVVYSVDHDGWFVTLTSRPLERYHDQNEMILVHGDGETPAVAIEEAYTRCVERMDKMVKVIIKADRARRDKK